MINDHPIERSIVHLCSNRWNSAISEYVVSSVRALEHLKKNQIVLTLKDSPLARRLQKETNVSVVEVNRFSLLLGVSLFFRLQKLRPSLAVCYGGPETSLMLLLKFFLRFRLWRFFGDAQRAHKLGDVFFFKLVMTKIDALILPSEKLAEKTRIALGDKLSNKVHHIQIGLSQEKFHPATSAEVEALIRELDLEKKRSRVLIFGRFDPVKGHAFAMAIFSELLLQWEKNSSEIPRPQLVIAGEEANIKTSDLTREWGKYTSLVNKDDLILISRRFQKPHILMSAAQIGWVSSLGSELIARVTQEFLLCGTKVFVSNAGALTECLREKSYGSFYLNETQPLNEIAKKLLNLLLEAHDENSESRLTRSKCAVRDFSIEQMAEKYRQLLNEV